MGKNIKWKKENGKKYPLPYKIKAVGNNIKWGIREGSIRILKRKSSLKKLGWGRK